MMINLAFKFFKKFKKRTSQGIKIVTFAISIILITQIFLTTLNVQVTNITNVIDSDTTVIKYDKTFQNNYSLSDIKEILDIVDMYESNIINYYFETEYFTEVYNIIDGKKYNISTHFVDKNFKILNVLNQNEIMMSEDLEGIYEIGDQINIKLTDNFQRNFTIIDIVSTNNKIIESGFYIPNYLINYTNYQTFNFEVSSDMVDILNNEIDKNIEDLNVEIVANEEAYIIEVYREFEIIINLLTIFMFILTLLGIINVSKVIILESKPEIRILKSLGYSRNSINLIFSIITGLMMVIGAVLAIPIATSMSNLSINIIGNTTFEVNNPITFDFLVVLRLVIVFVLAGSLITHIMTRDFIDRT